MQTMGGEPGSGTGRVRRLALAVYVAVCAVLLGNASIATVTGATNVLVALALLAAVVMVAGVSVRTPERRLGWWLTGAGTAIAAVCTVVAMGETGRPVWVTEWFGAPGVIAALVFFLIGLAVIVRFRLADVIDAAMVALAVFVAIYVFAVQPQLLGLDVGVVSAVGLLFVSLLLFALLGRALTTLRRPSGRIFLLLTGMAGFAATATVMLLPYLTRGTHDIDGQIVAWWLGWCGLFGVAGVLHESAGANFSPVPAAETLSRSRIVLFLSLAVIVPVAWFSEFARAIGPGHHRFTLTVPIVSSAALLLLVVWRLVLVALAAQRQARQLNLASLELRQSFREQVDLQNQLRYQAMHDPLTGLPNRLVLQERMEWTLRRPVVPQRHVSIALLDLDGFKDVNDTMGHPVGDELLIEVSRRLLDAAPQRGTVGRLGGDEFAAVLEDTPPEQATLWAEDVRRAITKPFHVQNRDLYLSTSIGICNVNAGPEPPSTSEVMRNADIALYAAKAGGKNRIEVFRPELRDERLQFTRISTGLRRALANDEFSLQYQPVIDLSSREILAVEALLRWAPEDQPYIGPEEFIPVAEENGTIVPIGRWVVEQACRDARGWAAHGISTSVNISVHQLRDPRFADFIVGVLRANDLPGRALTLEITERGLVPTSTGVDIINQLNRLRRFGVRIAIDDFGVGYSSLSYFATLPIDLVKIDKALLPTAGTGSQDWAVPRAIVQLAATLNLGTVAEGVETLEQAEMLRTISCTQAQGYLFAKPMPKEVVLAQLRALGDEA
jgi:diguanylate cyclase (GGDEF)-like protein